MKNKFDNLKSRKYLLLFIFVMVLNVSLTVVLFRVSFGQAKKEDFSSQQSINVNVTEQKDCPLRIVVVNVDNSALSYQTIVYSLQNVSSKPIRAYTLLGDGKTTGKVITNSFTTELFQPNKHESNDFFVERETVKEEKTISLSIDYVEFEDGSFWGNDSAGKSEEIAGEREGRKAVIKRFKDSIKNQKSNNVKAVTSLLEQDIKEISVDVPSINQSDEWKQGFRRGYKAIISVLQRIKEQGTENLTKKLDEMEKIAN